MHIIVLGAGAGGGFPQWNSNAVGCRRARANDPKARARTQTSVAVSADGVKWLLLNASPDIRQQIEATPQLQPNAGVRSSPICGVVLTNADVDAIAGLLTLRERQAFSIYATTSVHKVLRENPIFSVLDRDLVRRAEVPLNNPTRALDGKSEETGLEFRLLPVPGKTPMFLEAPGVAPDIETGEGTVAVEIRAGGARFFFAPGCAAMTPELRAALTRAALVFFDGTLWNDEELLRVGAGTKTGKRMGHMSAGGPGGSIDAFRDLHVRRKIFVHMNNSNPLLLDDSPEFAVAAAAGWEVGFDGMEIEL
jgi:pyrroloquinoline quinone biosynthesis protein B